MVKVPSKVSSPVIHELQQDFTRSISNLATMSRGLSATQDQQPPMPRQSFWGRVSLSPVAEAGRIEDANIHHQVARENALLLSPRFDAHLPARSQRRRANRKTHHSRRDESYTSTLEQAPTTNASHSSGIVLLPAEHSGHRNSHAVEEAMFTAKDGR